SNGARKRTPFLSGRCRAARCGLGLKRSIVAVQHVRAIVIAVAIRRRVVVPGMKLPVGMPAALVAVIMRPMMIAPPAGDTLFPIDPTRREAAGAGIGRALIDI